MVKGLTFVFPVSVVAKLKELVCVFKQLLPYNYILITWLQQSMKNILIWSFGTRWGSDNGGLHGHYWQDCSWRVRKAGPEIV